MDKNLELLNTFIETFSEVSKFLLDNSEKKKEIGKNPRKEDVTMAFDLAAEKMVVKNMGKLGFPVKILTEEQGELVLGKGEPEYVLVVDPVDGSTNYKRGIESTALSIAAIPADKEFLLTNVEISFVGNIWTGGIFSSMRGKGAHFNAKPINSSKTENLGEALIGMDIDFLPKDKGRMCSLLPLMESCKMIRRGGAAAIESAYVANGAYDAFVDIRGISTMENFIASSLIIREAGGVITNSSGNALELTSDLSKAYNWVASGNKKLHEEILNKLQGK